MPEQPRPRTEPRQRWRIVFRRGEEARFLAHLDAAKLWERALRRAGVPIAQTEGFNPRPRLVFAAPLPLGLFAEREIVDIVVSERLTRRDLRERLERDLPRGFALVDLHDVWVNAPSVASRLASATYRVDLAGARRAEVEAAIADLLGADRLDRERRKEKKAVAYDLRPLVLELGVVGWTDAAGAGTATGTNGEGTIRMRLKHAQEAGTGRPEEVVAALAERMGHDVETVRTVRECLTLVDEEQAIGGAPSSG